MRSTFAVVFAFSLFSVVNASEPSQPLDCSDWIFTEPGLHCTDFAPRGTLASDSPFLAKGAAKVVDNNGALYVIRYAYDCGVNPGSQHGRIEIVRFDGSAETVVAYVEDRDGLPNIIDRIRPRAGGVGTGPCSGDDSTRILFDNLLDFDPVSGRLLVPLRSFCTVVPFGSCAYPSAGEHWIAAIEGLSPLFEILQTYTPSTSAVNLIVPRFPDGLQGVDHLDTYYGPLVGPKDFSQAQPLRCNYPTTAPQPGDYLEAGIVPDPPSRQGYYYVTAATYQGETRYGRKRESGVLSGRDPSALPPCTLALASSAETEHATFAR